MTAEESQVRVAATELETFARKLDAFAQTLAPGERALLDRVLTRAAAADPEPPDTEGYIIIVGGLEQRGIIVIGGQPSPFLARAAGVSDLSAVKRPDRASPIL